VSERMVSERIVDAQVVDEAAADVPVGEQALVHSRPTREALVPLDADQVIEGMQAYQDLLPRLLADSDYQAAGRDKDGRPKRFVKKSGWRKIARAFNLSVEIVSVRVLRDEDGAPSRAEAICRAIAPNGQVQDGDGYCDIGEERFSGPRGNKSKLENDLRATATTRAKNRAIADLVGMGEVSAEEVDAGANQASLPAWALPAEGALLEQARAAVKTLGGGSAQLLDEKIAAACDGNKLPVAVAQTLAYTAACVAVWKPRDGSSA